MEGKKVLIVGVGVQGSTVAKCIDKNPIVSKIIVADRDTKAVNELVDALTKGEGAIVDGSKKNEIVKIAQKYNVDILVNAMPLPVMIPTLDAALEAQVNYLDFNAPWGQLNPTHLMEAYQTFLDRYDEPFKKIGKTLLGSSGISPGLINVVARHTMTYFDSCETIKMIFNEGLVTKKYIPFWWAPATALETTQMPSRTFVDGKLIFSKQYSGQIRRNYPETSREIVVCEHAHPEPVTMGYHSEEYYKGVQNVFFKYGGVGMDFAKPLLDIGLLSQEPEDYNGQSIVPYDFIVKHLPPAPKYPKEIKEYIDSGIVEENSAIVVESTGIKDGRRIMAEAHVYAPGLKESFEKMEFSSEMYSTGMSGALFTKMLLEDKITRTGVVTSDMFSDEEIESFFKFADEVGITFEVFLKEPIEEENSFIPIEIV